MLIFRAQEAENGHLTRILRVIARNMEFSIVAMRRTDRLRCSEGWVSGEGFWEELRRLARQCFVPTFGGLLDY